MALSSAARQGIPTPHLWLRYVDDVLMFWPHSDNDLTAFFQLFNEIKCLGAILQLQERLSVPIVTTVFLGTLSLLRYST